MKLADLDHARATAEARRKDVAMRDRIAAGENLSLMIGDDKPAQIVLTPSYLAGIRADLLTAFDTRIAAHDAALAALGVEP